MEDKTTQLDFEREMSHFLPQYIRSNTLKNLNFWEYGGQEIMKDVRKINNILTGKVASSSAKLKM